MLGDSLMAALASLFLHFARASAFVAVVPVFGQLREAFMLRLALAVALAVMFWWMGDRTVDVGGGLLGFALLVVRDVAVGLMLGFGVAILTAMLTVLGELISHELGFSMAQIVDPVTGHSSAIVAQFFQVVGGLLVFGLDLHHDFLRVLAATYHAVPVGAPFDYGAAFSRLQDLVSDGLLAGVQHALPMLGIMLVTTTVLALLSRAVPTINLYEFGFGVRALLALGILALLLQDGVPALIEWIRRLLEGCRNLFAAG
jgi:flagellar biosynthetic protein FliR